MLGFGPSYGATYRGKSLNKYGSHYHEGFIIATMLWSANHSVIEGAQ